MKSIEIPNEQYIISEILRDLERGDRAAQSRVRQNLNYLKRATKYRADKYKNLETANAAEKETAELLARTYERQYTQVTKDVNIVRNYLKDPQHVNITQALNRLNAIEAKRTAQIAYDVENQSNEFDQRMQGRSSAILTNTLYHYYGHMELEEFQRLSELSKQYLGFDPAKKINSFINSSTFATGSDPLVTEIDGVGTEIKSKLKEKEKEKEIPKSVIDEIVKLNSKLN